MEEDPPQTFIEPQEAPQDASAEPEPATLTEPEPIDDSEPAQPEPQHEQPQHEPAEPAVPQQHEPEVNKEELPEMHENVREQDRYLPIANIARVMKRPLPANAKIAKDAKETVQEALSEFISFITSEASDRCIAEKRKTISGEDLIHSLGVVGFEDYCDSLRVYLRNFREVQRYQNEAKLSVPTQMGMLQHAVHGTEDAPPAKRMAMTSEMDPSMPVVMASDQINHQAADE